MSWRAPSADAIAWVAGLPAEDWLGFARYLAPVVRIDQKLLRNMRLRFLPASDAGLESRLWWSPVVASRSALAISMKPDIARVLVDGADYDLAEVERAVSGFIDHWPDLVRLEQHCRFAALRRDSAAIDAALEAVVRLYLQADEDERMKILSWCRAALPDILSPEDDSEAGSWLGMLASNAWGDREDGERLPIPGGAAALPSWLRDRPPQSTPRRLGVRIHRGSLAFVAPAGDELDLPLDAPLPARLRVEAPDEPGFEARWEAVYEGRAITLPDSVRRVVLTTTLGIHYELTAATAAANASSGRYVPTVLYFDANEGDPASRLAAGLQQHGIDTRLQPDRLPRVSTRLRGDVLLTSADDATGWNQRVSSLRDLQGHTVVAVASSNSPNFAPGTAPVDLTRWLTTAQPSDLQPLLDRLSSREATPFAYFLAPSGDWGAFEKLGDALTSNGIRTGRTGAERVRQRTTHPLTEADVVIAMAEHDADASSEFEDDLALALSWRKPIVRLAVSGADEGFEPRAELAGSPLVTAAELVELGARQFEEHVAAWCAQIERFEPAQDAAIEIKLWFDDDGAHLVEQAKSLLAGAGFTAVDAEPWRDARESGDPALASFNTGAVLHSARVLGTVAERIRLALADLVPVRLLVSAEPVVTMFPGSRWALGPDVCYLLISGARDVDALADYVAADYPDAEVLDRYYFMHRVGSRQRFSDYPFNWEPFRDLAGPLAQGEGARPVFVIDEGAPLDAPVIAEHAFPAPHVRLGVAANHDAALVADAWLSTLMNAGAQPVTGHDWFLANLEISPGALSSVSREFLGLDDAGQLPPLEWAAVNMTAELSLTRHKKDWEKPHHAAHDRLRSLGLEVYDEYGPNAARLLRQISSRAQERVASDAPMGLLLLLRGYVETAGDDVHFLVDEKERLAVTGPGLSEVVPNCRDFIVVIDAVELGSGKRRKSASLRAQRPRLDANILRVYSNAEEDRGIGDRFLTVFENIAYGSARTSDDLQRALIDEFTTDVDVEIDFQGSPFSLALAMSSAASSRSQ